MPDSQGWTDQECYACLGGPYVAQVVEEAIRRLDEGIAGRRTGCATELGLPGHGPSPARASGQGPSVARPISNDHASRATHLLGRWRDPAVRREAEAVILDPHSRPIRLHRQSDCGPMTDTTIDPARRGLRAAPPRRRGRPGGAARAVRALPRPAQADGPPAAQPPAGGPGRRLGRAPGGVPRGRPAAGRVRSGSRRCRSSSGCGT